MRPSRLPSAVPLLLALVAAGACSDVEGGAGAAAPVVRDSAGVTIVESTEPVWGEAVGAGWTIDEAPALDVGELDGPAAYQFSQVSAVRRLGDGRIVVADNGATEIRAFGADGRHLWSAGRKGGGPGEFNFLSAVFVGPADSLIVPDLTARRLSVFSSDGELGRTVPLTGVGDGFPSVDGVFADGSFAVVARTFGMMRPGGDAAGRDTLTVLRLTPAGELRDTLARAAGGVSKTIQAGTSMFSTSVPFSPRTYRETGGDRMYLADSERWEVEERAADGTLLRRLRRAWTPPALDDETIEAHRAAQLAEAGTADERFRDVRRRTIDETPYPETMAAFSALLVDASGNLWLRRYADPREDEAPPVWDVLRGDDGAWLGAVRTPAGLRISEIGNDYVLGVWSDEYDVPHVRMHRLRKP